MALLKDSLVQGSLRVTDELYSDVAYLKTIYAGTSSSDSTPSSGTAGYVLKTDGNSVYWANDIDTDTHYTTHLRTASSATATTQVTAETTSPYLNLLDNSTVRDSVRFVGSGTTTVKSSADGKTITISLADGYGDTKNPYASKTKSYVLAAPSSANGAPTFRALVAADIPNLAWSKITSGNDDLKAIEDLAGTSGFLKKTAANTWTLDTDMYLPLADALWNTRGTLIPYNADLNTYNQTDNGLGNYYSPDSSTSSSLDNSPTANFGFRLISLKGYQNTRGYQIALGAPVTPWVRTETGTAKNYTDWAKILYKTGSSAIGGNSQPVYITADGKANVVSSVDIAHGGTGATAAAAARTNLLAATGNGRIFYGTCTTAGGTAAKVVTCASYDALTVGDVIVVDFSNANSAEVANLTLNVNNKGAKNIKKHYNSTAANNLNAVGVLTNSIHTFVYDGNYWILIDSDYNSSYSAMSVAEMRTGTATSSRVMRADYLKTFLSTLGGTKLTLSHTSTAITLNHDTSGVTVGTYGSNSTVPVIKVDDTGHITSAVNTTIVAGQVSTNVDNSKLTGLAGFVTNGTVPYRSPYFKVIGSDFYGLQSADIGDSTVSEGVKLYLSGTGNISMTGNIKGIASGTIATGTQGWSITNTGVASMTTLSLNNSNQTNPTNTLSITSSTDKEGLSIASSASNQGGQIELKTPDSSQGRIVLDFVYSGSTPKFRIIYYNSSGTAKVKELNCSTMAWS